MIPSWLMPTATFVALFVGAHWGWWKLQNNPDFVDPRDIQPHPVVIIYDRWTAKRAREKVGAEALASEQPREE